MNDKIKEMAAEALSHFETRERCGERIVVLKDDAPSWVHQLVRHAHDDMEPDDWRYLFILKSLSSLERGDFNGSELEPSFYHRSLTSWLTSDGRRVAYCDEAREEFGLGGDAASEEYGLDCDTLELIQVGQLLELREVFSLVKEYLEDRVRLRTRNDSSSA